MEAVPRAEVAGDRVVGIVGDFEVDVQVRLSDEPLVFLVVAAEEVSRRDVQATGEAQFAVVDLGLLDRRCGSGRGILGQRDGRCAQQGPQSEGAEQTLHGHSFTSDSGIGNTHASQNKHGATADAAEAITVSALESALSNGCSIIQVLNTRLRGAQSEQVSARADEKVGKAACFTACQNAPARVQSTGGRKQPSSAKYGRGR